MKRTLHIIIKFVDNSTNKISSVFINNFFLDLISVLMLEREKEREKEGRESERERERKRERERETFSSGKNNTIYQTHAPCE